MLSSIVVGELLMNFMISWIFFFFLNFIPHEDNHYFLLTPFMSVPLNCRSSREQSIVLLAIPRC